MGDATSIDYKYKLKPMKHSLLIITLICIAVPAFTQSNDHNFQYKYLYLPRDTDGNIVYQEVVEADGKSSDELFTASRLWFLDTFKSSKDVIQYEDRQAGIIAGKGFAEVLVFPLGYAVVSKVWMDIQVEAKDDRYRYTIKNIEWEDAATPGLKNSIETVFSEEWMYRKNGKPKPKMFEWYDKYYEMITTLESSLKSDISNPPPTRSTDW